MTLTAALALTASAAFAIPKGWTDDFDAALAQAGKEGKFVFAEFTRGDNYSKELEDKVFSKPEFLDAAKKDFVLVHVGKPSDRLNLSEKAAARNPELFKKYEVDVFPYLLVIDAEGNRQTAVFCSETAPAPFLEELSKAKAFAERKIAFLKDVKDMPQGDARRARIDEFLSGLGIEKLYEFEGYVNELLADDKDGKYARKYPLIAYANPLREKLKAAIKSVCEDIAKREKALGEDAGEEQKKALRDERKAAIDAKIAELRSEAGAIRAKVPEASAAMDEFDKDLDFVSKLYSGDDSFLGPKQLVESSKAEVKKDGKKRGKQDGKKRGKKGRKKGR